MPAIERAGTLIGFETRGRLGKTVEPATDEMAERMTAERVAAQQHDGRNCNRQLRPARPIYLYG